MRQLKARVPVLGLVALAILLGVAQGPQAMAEEGIAPELNGEAAALMDVGSGRLLYGYRQDEPLPPASTTKILTGAIALDHTSPRETVRISEKAQAQRGSQVYLTAGEAYPAGELVEALLLASANDAAVALAEHISGSVPDFARLMNRTAREWGAENSNFVNPHGLPDDGHVTTARDLAAITRKAMDRNRFADIVNTRESTMSWPGREEERELRNRNRLLWMDDSEGLDGVKTGYTSLAGNCLVGSATRDGRQLVAVVLGGDAQTYWDDVRGLLNYGFEQYENRRLVEPGAVVTEMQPDLGAGALAVETSGSLHYPLRPGEEALVEREFRLLEDMEAPVAPGEPAGELVVSLDGEEIGSVSLKAAHGVERVWYGDPEVQAVALGVGLGLLLLGILYLVSRRVLASKRGF